MTLMSTQKPCNVWGAATLAKEMKDGSIQPHIFIHKSLKKYAPGPVKNLIYRHEIGEVLGMRKDLATSGKIKMTGVFKDLNTQTGAHSNLGILASESNLPAKTPHVGGHGMMLDARANSGESSILEHLTGKRYGRDRFTKRDHRKLVNHVGNLDEPTLHKYLSENPHVDGESIRAGIEANYRAVHIADNYPKKG